LRAEVLGNRLAEIRHADGLTQQVVTRPDGVAGGR
jgi:hypothetical protein